MAAAVIYLDGQGLALWAVLACALHEIGHWAVITLLGGRVRALHLSAVGAEMVLAPDRPLSYAREAAAALAGPAANLLTAWLAARSGMYLFAGMNLSFGLLNLLPIRVLDGGRVLFSAVASLDPELAERVTRAVSAAVAGGLLGLGWMAWKTWGNLTLFCAAVWLLAGVLKS